MNTGFVAIVMAGKRQYNNLLALFDNWSMYTNLLDTSRNSLGTLQEQHEIYLESITAYQHKLTAEMQALYSNIIDEDAIIGSTKAITKLVEILNKVIEGLGGIQQILPLITALMVSAFSGKIAYSLLDTVGKISTKFKDLSQRLKEVRDGAEATQLAFETQLNQRAQTSKQEVQEKYDAGKIGEESYITRNAIIEQSVEREKVLNDLLAEEKGLLSAASNAQREKLENSDREITSLKAKLKYYQEIQRLNHEVYAGDNEAIQALDESNMSFHYALEAINKAFDDREDSSIRNNIESIRFSEGLLGIIERQGEAEQDNLDILREQVNEWARESELGDAMTDTFFHMIDNARDFGDLSSTIRQEQSEIRERLSEQRQELIDQVNNAANLSDEERQLLIRRIQSTEQLINAQAAEQQITIEEQRQVALRDRQIAQLRQQEALQRRIKYATIAAMGLAELGIAMETFADSESTAEDKANSLFSGISNSIVAVGSMFGPLGMAASLLGTSIVKALLKTTGVFDKVVEKLKTAKEKTKELTDEVHGFGGEIDNLTSQLEEVNEQLERYIELKSKSQAGTITAEEREELDILSQQTDNLKLQKEYLEQKIELQRKAAQDAFDQARKQTYKFDSITYNDMAEGGVNYISTNAFEGTAEEIARQIIEIENTINALEQKTLNEFLSNKTYKDLSTTAKGVINDLINDVDGEVKDQLIQYAKGRIGLDNSPELQNLIKGLDPSKYGQFDKVNSQIEKMTSVIGPSLENLRDAAGVVNKNGQEFADFTKLTLEYNNAISAQAQVTSEIAREALSNIKDSLGALNGIVDGNQVTQLKRLSDAWNDFQSGVVDGETLIQRLRDQGFEIGDSIANLEKNILTLAGGISGNLYQSLAQMTAQGEISIETFNSLKDTLEQLTNISGTSSIYSDTNKILSAYEGVLNAESESKRRQAGQVIQGWDTVSEGSLDSQLTFLRMAYEKERQIEQFAQYQQLQDTGIYLNSLLDQSEELIKNHTEAVNSGNIELAQSIEQEYEFLKDKILEVTNEAQEQYDTFMDNTVTTYRDYQSAIEAIYNNGEGLLSNNEAWSYLKDLPNYEDYFYKGSFEILQELIEQQERVNDAINARIRANKKELEDTKKIIESVKIQNLAEIEDSNIEDLETYTRKVEELQEAINSDEMELRINFDVDEEVNKIEMLGNELDKLYNMFHEKDDGGEFFRVTNDEIRQIINSYPELLAEHGKYVDGIMYLDSLGVDNFIKGKQEEVKASAEAKIQQMEQSITELTIERDNLQALVDSNSVTMDAINHAREVATMYELGLQEEQRKSMIDTDNTSEQVAQDIGYNFDSASETMANSIAAGVSSGILSLQDLGNEARRVAEQIANMDTPSYTPGKSSSVSTYKKQGQVNTQTEAKSLEKISKSPSEVNGSASNLKNQLSEMNRLATVEIDRLNKLIGNYMGGIAMMRNSYSGIGQKDKRKSSGGSGSSKKEKELKEIEYEEDLYHYINQELERQEKLLKKVSKIKDTLYGADYLDALEEEKGLLESINNLTGIKYDMQLEDLSNQRSYLAEQYGASFDENGLLMNYNALLAAKAEEINKLAEGQDEEAYKKAKEEYDKMEKDLDHYLKILKEAYDLEQTIIDNQIEIMENNLDAIVKKIEFDLQPTKDTINYLDFLNKFYENDFYQSGENLTRLNQKYLETADSLDTYKEGIESLKDAYANGEISAADFNEEVRNQRDSLQDALLTLSEIEEEMRHAYKDSLDDANDSLEDYTESLVHYNDEMEHFINLIDLIGEGHEYGALSNIYGSQSENYMEQLRVQKNWYDNLVAQKQLLKETGQEGTDAWLEVINALEKVEDEIYSLAGDALKALKDSYTNLIDDVVNKLDKALTNGSKIQNMLTQYERDRDLGGIYLDKPTQLYEIDSLQKDIEKTMENITDKLQKDQLDGLYEELDVMRQRDKISEYDMERMRARFELLQAQIALEDAQNAKNQLRLTRTSQGTWEYTYTADKSEVEDAANKVADAYNNLYQMSKEHMQSLEQQILDTTSQYEDALAQMYKDWADGKFESEEEFYTNRDNLVQYYEAKITELTDQYQQVRTDNALDAEDLILSTSKETGDALIKQIQENKDQFNEAVADMADRIGGDNSDSFKSITNDALDNLNDAWDNYNDNIDRISDEVGISLEEMQDKTRDLEDQSRDLADTIQYNVVPALQSEIEEVIRATAAHRQEAAALREKIQAYIQYLALLNQSINTGGASQSEQIAENLNMDTDWAREALLAAAAGNQAGMDMAVANRLSKLENLGMDYDPLKEKENFNNIFDQIQKGNEELRDKINELYGSGQGYTSETAQLLKPLFKKFDTGGYTNDGGLAILHEKELVLNKEDTKNMLDMVNITRDLLNTALGYQGAMVNFNRNGLGNSVINNSRDTLQDIKIEAIFPDVTSHVEIETALLNLATDASQYANRKR